MGLICSINIIRTACYIILGIFIFSDMIHAKDKSTANVIVNVDFEVAARRVSHGTAESGIYIFKLYCGLGECSAQQLSLNECQDYPSAGLAFIPRVQTWSTWSGSLEVQAIGDEIIELTIFQGTHKTLPARIRFTYAPEIPIAKRVTGFEAKGFINRLSDKDGAADEAIEYTPLVGSTQPLRLDCSALLHGIEK